MTRIAILGAGKIALAMAKTLRGMKAQGEPVCLYAVAARDLARAQAFAQSEGFEVAYGSYEEMLRDDRVDLVYVATPHSHHAEHMKLCIEHGKAVLCEKSFTANAQQAHEVFALAKEKRVLVTEAIWTRYMPSRQILRDIMDSGALGDIKMLSASLFYPIDDVPRLIRPELAGGALLDVGVYPLNFACMMFGSDPVRVESSVQLTDAGVDYQESFTLHYAGGRMAVLSAGMGSRCDRRCLISGSRGYVVTDNVNNIQRIELFTQEDGFTSPRVFPVPPQITGYEYEVRACLRALERGELECPEMPHAETLRVLELMDALRAQWGVRYPFEQ
ncbi:MAG: Gfo/Idh/MocA family oxidoreductase [Candidatus Ventricola sp.]|nr:Gfo/Idh/MocA family oxidoreductase [Candidatus Ventricola sp.]